jgi:guanylate kinase
MSNEPGPLIIISGPSGSGKSTLIDHLLAEARWPLRLSVSVTTRAPRPAEIEGVHYHFWQRERFLRERDAGGFLEWAEVHGNYYGTLVQEVMPYRALGHGVILDIDTRGAAQVERLCPDAVSIFVQSSSPAEYERRLRKRHTESEEQIQRRLRAAAAELAQAPKYDHQVINDDLPTAEAALRAIVSPLFERNRDAG